MRFVDFILGTAAIFALVIAVYLFSTDIGLANSVQNMTVDKKNKLNKTVERLSPFERKEKKKADTRYRRYDQEDSPWKYIVIHHSATRQGNAKVFREYHKKKMGLDGLAYHFVIGNGTYSKNGEIEYGEKWHRQQPGTHCHNANMNSQSIGICLVGNLDKDKATEKQMIALSQLVRDLQRRYDIPNGNVIGHKDADPGRTECPGKNFSLNVFEARLRVR